MNKITASKVDVFTCRSNNSRKFSDSPSVEGFTLTNSSNEQLDNIKTMDQGSDANNHLQSNQFALFPKHRLEWGTKYTVELIYTSDETQGTKRWEFATRSLEHYGVSRVYRIENDRDITLDVKSGVIYGIYVVPNDGNDLLGGSSITYTGGSQLKFSSIDRNTMWIKYSGNIGDNAKFTFDNGQKIKLLIADSDAANNPKNEQVKKSENGDGDGDSDGSQDGNSGGDSKENNDKESPDNNDGNNSNSGNIDNNNDSKGGGSGSSGSAMGYLFPLLFVFVFIRRKLISN